MRADKAKVSRLLKTARGQIDGVLKMVEEDRYCIDISNQILAAEAVLNKANREIIKAHMKGCIKEALENDSSDEKIDEFLEILDKIAK
jgi:DNA-binding FrmR family transcriptional regulator